MTRTAKVPGMEICDTRSGYSFFRTIDRIWGNLNPKYSLHRICTIMRSMNVATVVIENLHDKCAEWKRFQEEQIAISVRLGISSEKIHATKFTFLRDYVKDESMLSEVVETGNQKKRDPFLGYAIIVSVEIPRGVWSYVLESVVRELGTWNSSGRWEPLQNYYLHVKKTFDCEIIGKQYAITGTYFRQQNSITNVCAHACVSMMLANASLPNGIVTPEALNGHLGYDHRRKKFRINKELTESEENLPAGLDLLQLQALFRHYGYEPKVLEFNHPDRQLRFRSFLYGFVESKFPALLTFGPGSKEIGHVVPVFGHTFNPNSWLPITGTYAAGCWTNQHHSSLGWVDDLIIHDDNYGMQFALPAHAFKPAANPDQNDNLTPREGLGIFPSSYRIQMLSPVAEATAASIIRQMAKKPVDKSNSDIFSENYYTERLRSDDGSTLRRTTIFRPILVSWIDYQNSFWNGREIPSDTAAFIKRINDQGISHVWIVEVTEPDLFIGNRAKVLDVILNPHLVPGTVGSNGWDPPEGTVLMVRMPQGAIVPRSGGLRGWDLISGWERAGHMPLLRHQG
jgi:hypothetical protein